MNVEIAICTWNRAESLNRTLNRLGAILVPDHVSLRVIVVDNNSTDKTGEAISRFSTRLNIGHFNEKRQGHCFARNRAIDAAEGELLLWIDDDVLVGDMWLSEYVAAAEREPESSFWGGPIIPRFESAKPRWIEDNWEKLSGCFAFRDLGEQELQLTSDRLPYGANLAIRTAVQKEFPFNTKIGRTNAAVVGEDELEMLRRVLDDNCSGRWVPGAGVLHMIDSSRTTTKYIGNYFIGQGQALVTRGEAWSTDIDSLEREASHELFWFRVRRYLARSEVWVSHLIRGSLARGQAIALKRKNPA